MANVEKEMIRRPAKWPLDTLEACIRDFQWRREPGGGMDVKADDIPGMCAEAGDFPSAVWYACASRRRSGRMHTHQTKVKVEARREFGYRIISHYLIPGRWEPQTFRAPADFHDFHETLWDIRPEGIGPLTTYDVATRVGAWLKLEPTRLYLHTGARMGWNAMWGFPFMSLSRSILPDFWPAALRMLSADMAEDFLCTYRDTLKGIARDRQSRPL